MTFAWDEKVTKSLPFSHRHKRQRPAALNFAPPAVTVVCACPLEAVVAVELDSVPGPVRVNCTGMPAVGVPELVVSCTIRAEANPLLMIAD